MSQIGCGYCAWEDICSVRRHSVNLTKMGCPSYRFYLNKEGNNYDDGIVTSFVNALDNSNAANDTTVPDQTPGEVQR